MHKLFWQRPGWASDAPSDLTCPSNIPLISKTTLYSRPALHRLYHPHFALSCPHLLEPFPHCRSSIGIPNIHHPPRRLLCTSRSTLPSCQGSVALDVARMLLAPPDILAQTMTSLLPCWTSHIVLPFATYLRRGPLQGALTTNELRELITITNVPFASHKIKWYVTLVYSPSIQTRSPSRDNTAQSLASS